MTVVKRWRIGSRDSALENHPLRIQSLEQHIYLAHFSWSMGAPRSHCISVHRGSLTYTSHRRKAFIRYLDFSDIRSYGRQHDGSSPLRLSKFKMIIFRPCSMCIVYDCASRSTIDATLVANPITQQRAPKVDAVRRAHARPSSFRMRSALPCAIFIRSIGETGSASIKKRPCILSW